MSPALILGVILTYFLVLMAIAYFTSRGADNQSFFLADKSAPWYLVAFGMIGASLSGITFISIPGIVGDSATQFSYMQIVMGYIVGYVFIAFVLMPVYYKLNVTSIYTYLEKRFNVESYKTGAFYFLLSRTIGASIRLLLVANVLQEFVFADWNIPFEVTVLFSILLIWIYTYRGGIKTIIWTDTLQTLFMLIALGVSIYYLSDILGLSEKGLVSSITESEYSQWFFFNDFMTNKHHFIKEFIGGIFICIGMTGMDQDMMQKNLSCRTLKAAQTNMLSFAAVLFFVNLFFLALGAMLFMYMGQEGIELPLSDSGRPRTDLLFPIVALESGMPVVVGLFFLLGLIAAAYSSADSALTSLTTSACVDFLDIDKKEEKDQIKFRKKVHIWMSLILLVVILILHRTLDLSAIYQLIYLAGFTYGPLIGLFLFGLITKRNVAGPTVILIAVLAPVLSYIISKNTDVLLEGYSFGAELILFNALLTFAALFIFSKNEG